MLNHSRDMSFNRGFLKEDTLQSMRDELAHRDGGYQKPPKTIHEHRMVGEAPRDFSKEEILHILDMAAEFERDRERDFLSGKVVACPALPGDQKWSFNVRKDWLKKLIR